MSYSQQRTLRRAADQWDGRRLDDARQSLRARLTAPLKAAGHDETDMVVAEVAAVRYSGQSYAIEIADPSFDDPDGLGRAFLERHQALYGFATEEPWELVSIRQHISVPRPHAKTTAATAAAAGTEDGPAKISECIFSADGAVPTPRYDRSRLAAERAIRGPAIIEDEWSTVILPPGASMIADAQGHLHIEVGAAS
jgi:N-methylhydantoinase A